MAPDGELFGRIFDAAPNAMLLVDDDGSIRLANVGAEQLFGRRRDQLVGRPVTMLVPTELRASHAELMRSYFEAPTRRPMGSGRPLHALGNDGREIPVEIGLNPIETEKGRFVIASITDLTESLRHEERFRLLLDSVPNASLMVDAAGTIRLANRKAVELFGYDRRDLIGSPVELLVPDSIRREHPRLMAEFMAAPRTRLLGAGRDLRGRRRDGSEVPVEIGLAPIIMPDGLYVFASIMDITERRRREDDLKRSNAELEQFAHVASHDLQEPLRTIANYGALLERRYQGRLDEKADKYIFYMVDGARRMQRLVSDLLAFSRVGSTGRELVPVALKTIVDTVLHALRSAIRESGARIEFGELPRVLADPDQIGLLLQNLLTNALKFRSEAPPEIRIEADRDPIGWRISVTDNGIGMDPRYADRAFQMFQRLHERDAYPGSGLGLAIARKIVEQHGGSIGLESEPGRGTTIHFTLAEANEGPAP